MKDFVEQSVLFEEIKKRIPRNSELAATLQKILNLSKEATYRRLRNEVPFSFQEVSIIAKDLGISLDNIIGIDTQKSRPLQMKLPEFVNPSSNDYYMLDDYISFLKTLANSSDTIVGMMTNVIPQDLFSGFEYLVKYNIFKWQYHYYNSNDIIPFHDLIIPNKVVTTFKSQFAESKKFKKTYCVLDKNIFRFLVNDLHYFHKIRLIRDDDIANIKKDLLSLLDYLESITINGKYKETGQSVLLYVSELDITSFYTYIKSGDIKFSLIKTFLLTSATSLDEKTFNHMIDWIHASMKASTLITGTNYTQRISYFYNQRAIVNEL